MAELTHPEVGYRQVAASYQDCPFGAYDESAKTVDEWDKISDKLQKNATNLKKYRNITLVNDYLRFALKIFIYLGVLLRTPFDFQQLTSFLFFSTYLNLPVNNW